MWIEYVFNREIIDDVSVFQADTSVQLFMIHVGSLLQTAGAV